MGKTSVIEINGNRYDAASGQLIETVKKLSRQVKNAPTGVIDGFSKRGLPPTALDAPSPPKKTHSLQEAPKKAARHLKAPAQTMHKRTQKSHTLMRHTVAKLSPVNSSGDEISKSNIQTNHFRTAADMKRASRAERTTKHSKIRRFGGSSALVSRVVEPSKPAVVSSSQKVLPSVSQTQAVSTVSSAKPTPSLIGNISGQQLERLLDHALMRANSHNNPNSRPASRGPWKRFVSMPKWASIGASAMVVLLLGGFFAWQNVPELSMRMAAQRANIAASVPDYTPSGFSFAGPISYSNGSVSIRFRANSDSYRTFSIVQEKSSWNSQSLAANSVPAGTSVQTSQIKGTTVYIYGASNDATWVDRGIKFTLHDQANLTSDQILKIAGSL